MRGLDIQIIPNPWEFDKKIDMCEVLDIIDIDIRY